MENGSLALYVRYVAEAMMLLPGGLCLYLLTADRFRVRRQTVIITALAVLIPMIFGGAALCMRLNWPVNYFLFPCAVILGLIYGRMTLLGIKQQLFVLFNTMMLCAWPVNLSNYMFAAREAANNDQVFTLSIGIFCLGMGFAVVLIFADTLSIKVPALLEDPSLEKLWNWFYLIPLAATLLMMWLIPKDLSNVLVGRVQMIAIVFWFILLLAIYAFYQFFWFIAGQVNKERNLQQENRLLRLQESRYQEITEYMAETRRLRHDFRQHMRVLSEMAAAGKINDIREYLKEYAGSAPQEREIFCSNPVIDAIAAFYDKEAEQSGVDILWDLEGSDYVPLTDSELSVVLGNLVENALEAVGLLPMEERRIRVKMRMIGENMLGISVANRYGGSITLDKEGLPVTRGRERIGLRSVIHEVTEKQGTWTISTEDGWFSFNILFYCA